MDLMAFKDYHSQDKKINFFSMITEINLIIVLIFTGNHFYLYLFIRIEKKKFFLMQLDSLYSENRIKKNVIAQ